MEVKIPETTPTIGRTIAKKLRKFKQKNSEEKSYGGRPELKSKTEILTDNLKQSINDPQEKATNTFKSAHRAINTKIYAVKSHLDAGISQGTASSKRWQKRIKSSVTAQPFTSVAAALGLGAISAWMLKTISCRK